MADDAKVTSILVNLGVDPATQARKVQDTLKNKKLCAVLVELSEILPIKDKVDPAVGTLLFTLASVFPPEAAKHRTAVAKYVHSGKAKALQIEAAAAYFKKLKGGDYDVAEFEKTCGIGVFPTEAEIVATVDALFKEKEAEIKEKRYHIQGTLLAAGRIASPFGDRAVIMAKILEKLEKVLGPKTAEDKKPAGPPPVHSKPEADKKPAAGAAEHVGLQESIRFPPPEENSQATKELLKKHLEATGGKIVTRFPPEPNGYLHFGHAKAMSLDYGYAKKLGGICYMRFDDTNPEAESQEFIDSILNSVKWMGHHWVKVTYASDYFDQLYDLAIELIKRDKAFVCHLSGDEISKYRETREPSPWRNRPIAESLEEFKKMREGRVKEGECCLRMKQDINSPNPCMWDLVAYRVKFHPHPRTGDKWCIYPSYDFTHCINDSLENITHSLCTLEFVPRRESYNWLLDALGLYRPVVWEFARLNLTYTVLSKRKLIHLVNTGICKGWDDPRMPTLVGAKRRGFTPEAMNKFCEDIGVTRNDGTVVPVGRLEECVRDDLNAKAIRAMAVVDPIKLTITNWDQGTISVKRPNIPEKDEAGFNEVPFSGSAWIQREDFKEEDIKNYYGAALKTANGQPKWVRLRYAAIFKVTKVIKNDKGDVVELLAECDKENKISKTMGALHWVDAGVAPVEVELRLYDHLFTVEDPAARGDAWLTFINPNSLVTTKAYVDPTVSSFKVEDKVQFERLGYFCVDKDTKPGHMVFNRSVKLKESKDKPKGK